MKLKPNECCGMGSCEHQIPMPICGRIRGIDFCIADIVAALNAANIITDFSCCGHGDETKSVIGLEDGRFLHIRKTSVIKTDNAPKPLTDEEIEKILPKEYIDCKVFGPDVSPKKHSEMEEKDNIFAIGFNRCRELCKSALKERGI